MAQPPKLDLVPLDLQSIDETPVSPTKGTSLSDRWKQISEPLTDAPSRFGQSVSDYITEPNLASSPTGEGGLRDLAAKIMAMGKGFAGGALEGVGNIASSLTSPLSLATIGLGGAEYGAGKAGLSSIARLLGLGTRVASAPFAIHGVSEVIRPDATLGERAMGVAEAAGGAAGMLHVPGRREPNVTRTTERPSGSITVNAPESAQPIIPFEEPSIKPEITPKIISPKLDLQPIVEPAPIAPKLTLPSDLSKSKPRFNMGSKGYIPEFADDLDKALFVIAQKNPSKRDADFLKLIMDTTGLDEAGARTAGEVVRKAIKEQVKGQPEGKVVIQPIFNKVTEPIIPPIEKPTTPQTFEEIQARMYELADKEKTNTFTSEDLKEAQALNKIWRNHPEFNNSIEPSIESLPTDELPSTKPNRLYKPNPLGDNPLGDVPLSNEPGLVPPALSTIGDSVAGRQDFAPGFFDRIKPEVTIPKEPNITYLIRQDKATPDFIKKAQEQGYKFQGLNDKGDYKFAKPQVDILPPEVKNDKFGIPTNRDLTPEEVTKFTKQQDKMLMDSYGEDTVEGQRAVDEANGTIDTMSVEAENAVHETRQALDEGNIVIHPSTLKQYVSEGYRVTRKLSDGYLAIAKKPIGAKQLTASSEISTGSVVILRKDKITEDAIRQLAEKRFEFLGENDQGDLRFKKTAIKPASPVKPPNKPPPINEPPVQPLSPNAEPIIIKMKDTSPEQAGIVREAWNVSRGLMSVDLPFITSAGLRQGFPMIGTKAWFEAWGPSIKSYGSKAFHEAHAELLRADPLMQRRTQPALKTDGTQYFSKGRPVLKEIPSIAEEAGVVLTDIKSLTTREESIRSQLAERIPIYGRHVAANNRAYTAYINDLRLSTFRNFYEAMPDKNNIVALKQLGDAANTFTGRGPLKTMVPFSGGKEVSLEKYASGLAEALFAPKLIASRLQMLNPVNYVMTNPQVRKEYVKAALRTAGAWMTFAAAGKLVGAEVSLDPTNTDFGKIKIGNIRFDPGAGFQQFIVYLARMSSNQYTSSTTEKTQEMGVKYNSPTRGSVTQNFVANKAHPSAKFFYDAGFANSSRQFGVFDRMVQMAVPMITGDLIDISREQPELLPIFAPLMSAGLGTQFYTGEKGEMNKPMFIPRANDIVLGGKR